MVDFNGKEFTIPAMSAADWLALLMDQNLTAQQIFPGLLSNEDQAELEDLLHAGKVDLEEFLDVGLEVVTTVSGRKWWVALRLILVAQGSWEALGGDMMMKADPTRLSLAGWLDVLFTLIVRNIEDAKRTMFLMKLETVPEGWEDESEESEMSASAFMALAD